jgi:hypothetical protein
VYDRETQLECNSRETARRVSQSKALISWVHSSLATCIKGENGPAYACMVKRSEAAKCIVSIVTTFDFSVAQRCDIPELNPRKLY